ncbi:MAG: 3-oxoacyl-[acyl-carrier-protein] reductase [Proteobacteria bacterium]|nr:3-oxoacyl-[acyl-carrier-protein] reductase [Pseudomonadota bacterium]
MFDLKDRVVLVTGGSRGIGRSICVALAQAGARIFVNYASSPQAAEETVALCVAAGAQAEAMQFDISSTEAVDAAVEQIKAKAGKLDILVNNAGISKDGLFVRLKDEDWDRTVDTNLKGAFICSRAAARLMMKNRYGRIINISSVVGEMGNAGQVPYVSSKAGLIGLTKAMAKELASRSVTVNAVAPGFISTDMTAALGDNLKAEYEKTIPLGRFGAPEEVGALVRFLASDEASYITGQTIGINGGMYM